MFITLQFGRGLAAIAVAAFHLSDAMGDAAFGGTGVRPFASIVGRGYLGVDFFFVLSGFIILQAHYKDIGQPARAGRYMMRRFLRIYPIYWIYLTVCIVGMAAVGSSHFRLSSPLDWLAAYGLVRLTPVELPLAQAWTLFHEAVFYAIFSVLLFNRRAGIVLLCAWALAVVLSFHYPSSERQTFVSTVLGAYNLNFMVGMLAFILVERLSRSIAWCGLLAGFALFVVTYHVHGGKDVPAAIQLGYALSFGIILSCAVALERSGGLSLPVWTGFAGNASYSIYLLHEHAETYSLRALIKLGVVPREAPAAVFLTVLTATVVIGCLAYLMIERPLLNRLRARFDQPTARV